MPDAGTITKEIVEKYTIDTRGADKELARLTRRSNDLKASMSRHAAGAARSARTLTMIGGAALGGLGFVAKKLFDIGAGAETSEIALGGLIQRASKMQGVTLAFGDARKKAMGLRKEFVELARTSPVTAGEVGDAFSQAAFGLSAAGVSFAKQAETARGIAIADLSNAVKGTAAMDVKQLLAGTATQKQTQTAILKPIVEEVKAFVKSGDMQAAAKLIQDTLTPDPEQLKAFEESAGGAVATLTDRVNELSKKAAKPLLKFVIKKVKELLKWMDQNKRKVEAMAKAFGEGVVGALKTAAEIARFLVDNWRTIAMILATITTVSMVKMVAQMGMMVVSAAKYLGLLRAASRTPAGPAGAGGGKGAGVARVATGVGVALGFQAAVGDKDTNDIFGLGAFGASMAGLSASVQHVQNAARIRQEAATGGAGFMTEAQRNAMIAKNDAEQARQAAGGKATQLAVDALVGLTGATASSAAAKKAAKKGRGGGRQKVAVMEVDQLKVDGESFARLASPLVLGMQQRAAMDRPLSATVGLGGLSVPNGTP